MTLRTTDKLANDKPREKASTRTNFHSGQSASLKGAKVSILAVRSIF